LNASTLREVFPRRRIWRGHVINPQDDLVQHDI
jgi:hypothetical protein